MEKVTNKPELLIIGGPNGAGNTTFINTYLPEFTNVREFVNADLIAKGLSPFEPEGALIEAGRLLLKRVHQLIEDKISFALESTLSGKSYLDLIQHAKGMGYIIRLYFIHLNSVELSINRIEDRVRKGGHNVERDIVIRRYERSVRNLFSFYLPLVDEWELFDNSGSECRLLATKVGEEMNIIDQALYLSILNTYGR